MRMIYGVCSLALLLMVAGFSDAARGEGLGPAGLGPTGLGPAGLGAAGLGANGEYIPVYPRYPYRAGHYPKADWYYDLPPYVAIDPSFYRRRYFMMAQERDRYRYMPHIFHGYNEDGYAYPK